jgi:hypothetical protein
LKEKIRELLEIRIGILNKWYGDSDKNIKNTTNIENFE